mmetsp:Transcript_11206/g.17602  ORF Transcript_11206/g.17602 Transcript_11206/m.17602 type:complete len:84 (+) Transcript_11206:671-922(+)
MLRNFSLQNKRPKATSVFFFVRVIPVATEIVGPIIQKYGFSASEQGALEFLEAIGQHQDDLSIKESLQFLNSQFMPNNDSKGT